ncbi:MAG: histidinol-phosphate transaminase [Pseudomonadota bacterium]
MTNPKPKATITSTAPVPKAGILSIHSHMLGPSDQSSQQDRIDVSSNESAFGPSPLAREAAQHAGHQMERYSIDGPERLSAAIGATFGLDPAKIACGHGSDDLLARLARAYLSDGDELIHSRHGYQKFPNYAYANNAVPIAAKDQNFRADVGRILDSVTEATRMVMLANPDNPTGTHLSGAEVRELHDKLPRHVVLVLDSAYCEYADAADYEDPVSLIDENRNVVMTRTFSKIFGLAGLRIGWLYGPAEMVDVVKRIGLTFPLSNMAVAAGVAASTDREHCDFVRQETARIKEAFAEHLAGLGVETYPSQTNFLLANFSTAPLAASQINERLEAAGILARRMAAPAFNDCLRITIGTAEEMERVARELSAILKD